MKFLRKKYQTAQKQQRYRIFNKKLTLLQDKHYLWVSFMVNEYKQGIK